MDIKTYVIESSRTAAESVYPQNVAIDDLIEAVTAFTQAASNLDTIKKALYYNKATPHLDPQGDEDCSSLVDTVGINTLHGIIGIATEAGELVEFMLAHLMGHKDIANMSEEIGDVFWYIAMLCRQHGFDPEGIMQQNISKLMLRYPEKFDTMLAEERNLQAEYDLLVQTTAELSQGNSDE